MKLTLLLILSISLYANAKQQMYGYYTNSLYEKACNVGFDHFKQNNQDEEYISLYAFSCLNSDYIDRLAAPIGRLKFSKEARGNSAYFSIILMQKKLLYHALVDGYNLTTLKLPTTKYVLSKVFDFYSQVKDPQNKNFYIFTDKDDKKRTYKLYLNKQTRISKMVIEVYYDSKLVKKHIYW